jgi:hypothetical protein
VLATCDKFDKSNVLRARVLLQVRFAYIYYFCSPHPHHTLSTRQTVEAAASVTLNSAAVMSTAISMQPGVILGLLQKSELPDILQAPHILLLLRHLGPSKTDFHTRILHFALKHKLFSVLRYLVRNRMDDVIVPAILAANDPDTMREALLNVLHAASYNDVQRTCTQHT